MRWRIAPLHFLRRISGTDFFRTKACTKVVILHAVFLSFLAIGLNVRFVKPSPEYEMTISGPVGNSSEAKPPKIISPELPTVVPPDIEVSMAEPANQAAVPAGSPNVSRPAEALAEAHMFPKLPADMQTLHPAPVLLAVLIAENGQVIEATVRQSSGFQNLDAIATDWVKRNWHYRPAMRNGYPTSETTVAIVRFLTS